MVVLPLVQASLFGSLCFPDLNLTQMPNCTGGIVVIVDPFPVQHLVHGARSRGKEVIAIQIRESDPDVPENLYLAIIRHSGGLDARSVGETAQKILEASKKQEIVACLCGHDSEIPLQDALACALQLPGNAPETSACRSDKWSEIEQLRSAGLRATKQAKVMDLADVKVALDHFTPFPEQVVVKPSNSGGTDGVTVCLTPEAAVAAIGKLLGTVNGVGLVTDCVVIQEFLQGEEYVVDSISFEGEHKLVGLWRYDKRPLHGVQFAYFGARLLSSGDENVKKVVEYYLSVLDALGVMHGASHGEVKLTPSGPCLVEMGARCHGSRGSWIPLVQEGYGYDQVSAYLDAALQPEKFTELPCWPDFPPSNLSKHFMLLYLQYHTDGVFEKLCPSAWERIRKMESYFSELIVVERGCEVKKTIDILNSPGFIGLVHEDETVLMADYQSIHDMMSKLFEIH